MLHLKDGDILKQVQLFTSKKIQKGSGSETDMATDFPPDQGSLIPSAILDPQKPFKTSQAACKHIQNTTKKGGVGKLSDNLH